MDEPVRVGLVGAGPWAQHFTAPMLAAAGDVAFTGVWARRPAAAEALAIEHATRAVHDLDELLAGCDAIALAVPPAVQADLALRAATAGKALLLDKPVGATVAAVEALAEACDRAGVVSQLVLTNRYLDRVRAFLAAAASFDAYGARASFFGGGALDGQPSATPWRRADGGLLDLGPHVLDALAATLGPIAALEARGDAARLVVLTCEHEGGAVSQAAVSATTDQAGGLAVELHGPMGRLQLDLAHRRPHEVAADDVAARHRVVEEFVACVRHATPHPLDVHHGLVLQRWLAEAEAQLHARRR